MRSPSSNLENESNSPGSIEEKVLNEKDQYDPALTFILQANKGEVVDITPEKSRKLRWKIDLYLFPLLSMVYCIQFLDKVAVGNAAVLGLRHDLHMTGNMFSWTGSAFYIGYLVFVYPLSWTIQRYSLSKLLSAYIVIWGTVVALLAVCNYPGFITLRVIMGALESSVTPAFVVITSQWYQVEEQFLRTNLWFSCNGLGTVLSGFIAYGLITHSDYAIARWQLFLVIVGCITVVLGIAVYFHLPDNPTKAWFMTDDEKVMLVSRIRSNKQGFGNKQFKKYQLIEALTDVRTWIYFAIAFASDIPNGGLTNFTSILLKDSLHYSEKQTFLMIIPQGVVEFIGLPICAYIAHKMRSRLPTAIATQCIVVAGVCLLAFTKHTGLQYAGLCVYGLSPITFTCALSSVASNCAGHTKKLAMNAIVLIGYCIGNIIGPQTFRSSEAPQYIGAKLAIVICYAITLALLVLLYVVNVRENQRRDALAKDPSDIDLPNRDFADITDKENADFRYAL